MFFWNTVVTVMLIVADVDECQAAVPVCGAGALAVCHNTPGSYSCTCIAGYIGDGNVCTGW